MSDAANVFVVTVTKTTAYLVDREHLLKITPATPQDALALAVNELELQARAQESSYKLVDIEHHLIPLLKEKHR